MLFSVINKLEDLEKGSEMVDGIELRLDRFKNINIPELKKSLKNSKIPFIFTLRPERQGGSFKGTEEQRLLLIESLFALNPPYFDLEYDIDPFFLEKMKSSFKEVKIILSFHDFEKTPPDLDQILRQMTLLSVYSYKIATLANNSLDALKMMVFLKENSFINLTALCMGSYGQITRVLGKILGSLIDYTTFQESSFEKQLSFKDLINTYHYLKLNKKTKVFALIGSPVENSVGHIAHNPLMEDYNSVYIKIDLKEEELSDFFSLVKKLPFKGFSVTTPLKSKVTPFLSKGDPLQVNNTILIQNGQLLGYNTDGRGALMALQQKIGLKGKTVALLGAGDTAKAIASSLKNVCTVLILNRDKNNGEKLSKELNIISYPLEDLKNLTYEILINATSTPFPTKISQVNSSATFCMDVSVSFNENSLLGEFVKKGGSAIYGIEMFLYQAVYQEIIWFKNRSFKATLLEMEKILCNYLPLKL